MGHGLAGNVVLRLLKSLPEKNNYKIFADNFFTSMKLVETLTEKGFLYVGTVQERRLKGITLASEQQLKELGRGSWQTKVIGDRIVAVSWYDNKKINLVSNYISAEPLEKAKLWSKKTKQYVKIWRPAVVTEYNKFMGGVDLLDMLTSLYKPGLRSKRWYLYIFRHFIHVAACNSWLIHRKECNRNGEKQLSLRQFVGNLSQSLVKVATKKRGRPSIEHCVPPKLNFLVNIPPPTLDVRKDGFDHFPKWSEKRMRCKFCAPGFTYVVCMKCETALCFNKDRNCFLQFHN